MAAFDPNAQWPNVRSADFENKTQITVKLIIRGGAQP
jgi:hypothetical protein